MGKTLFLLDGMALLYRAHFAFISNPIRTSKGLNTSAVYGFLNVLLDLKENRQPTHLAVALDTPEPTERHRIYPEYKAQREAMPEDLAAAIPLIHRLCEAMNIPLLKLDGYEADDIIGTLARKAEKEGFTTYMVTPDKDFSQLVTEHTFLFKPGRKGGAPEIEGVEETCKRWEVERPEQVIDILGLWGDASDNIPGVPGVGEKTAKKLISEHHSIESLLENTSSVKGKMGEKLAANKDQALLSQKLATIDLQVPIDWNETDLAITAPNEDLLKPLIVELEFNALGKRLFGDSFKAGRGFATESKAEGNQFELDFSAASTAENVTEPNQAEGANLKTLAEVPHQYECVQTEEALDAWIQKLSAQEWFCLDTETTGLDPKIVELLGFSFSCEEGKACYLPTVGEGSLPSETIRAKLSPLFENAHIGKVGHNLKYDLSVLRWHGYEIRGPLIDTMILHSLVRADQKHGMDFLAEA
ncbi:MAG: DNA polymerase I, partial [Verrucomicrobia bacterium]|nr:DNA polymerase I [Verrucomicrobiota bacterium]